MPKRYFLPFAPGLTMLAFGVTGSIAGPGARTQTYFALQRQWTAHWPLAHGVALPRAIQPFFRPFTPVWVQVEPNVRMLLDPDDYVAHTILETGSWEPESWAAVREHLGSGATFVDIGAHIGTYSLRAAPIVGPAGRVIAIEPNPETVRKLQGNIQASGAQTITVEPFACSDAEATLELFAGPQSNSGETSLSQTNASRDQQAGTSYKVRARPLDAILQEAGVTRVDAVKIDVEGAEVMVLKGAGHTLDRYHPVVLIEVVDQQLRSMGTSAKEVYEFFRAHGYAARRSFADNVEFAPKTATISQ
jgi:FkbM family methyltransferase